MNPQPLSRTEYRNLSIPGTVRSGPTTHGESLTDVESYLLPLSQSANSSLHTPGVADGLTVTATPGQKGVTVAAGVAVDAAGHVIVLAAGGSAVTDRDANPSQLVNVPTVPVDASGVPVDTTGLTGDLLLTVTWAEVIEQDEPGSPPVLIHAPWLRLLAADAVLADARQVILAGVSLDAGASVTGLSVDGRVSVGLPASSVQIRRQRSAAGPPLTVGHVVAADLGSDADGGLTLDLATPDTPRRVLAVDPAGTTLSLLPAGGTVNIGPALSLRGVQNGGLQLGLTAPAGPVPILDIDAAGRTLSLLPAGGTVNMGPGLLLQGDDTGFQLAVGADADFPVITGEVIRVDQPVLSLVPEGGTVGVGVLGPNLPDYLLQVEGDSGVHSGGSGGDLSFADQSIGKFVAQPAKGERWKWYAKNGSARLWSGQDYLVIDPNAPGGGLDVQRRMRVRQGSGVGDQSAGIWFYQGKDLAFVGMRDNKNVGFYGNLGAGWGLTMDSINGNVGIGDTLPISDIALRIIAPKWAIVANATVGLAASGTDTGVASVGGIDGHGLAGNFVGNVQISGALSKGGGGFKIDHPLDPENRYLSHSSVESPEMLNVYRGTVTTDRDGAATVRLPDYAGGLNRDFSYHLTVVGEFARAAVATTIQDGEFTVRTDRPETIVCWMVLGERDDPWAQAHRIPVEEDKPAEERSLYMHPELYGHPVTMSAWHRKYPPPGN